MLFLIPLPSPEIQMHQAHVSVAVNPVIACVQIVEHLEAAGIGILLQVCTDGLCDITFLPGPGPECQVSTMVHPLRGLVNHTRRIRVRARVHRIVS